MTLSKLIEYANIGCAITKDATNEEHEEIQDFSHNWYILRDKDIKDLKLYGPELYGYNIEQLVLIARILAKEGLPPERVVEALTDIGRIIVIVSDEFEESLRRSVDECFSKNRLKTMSILR